MLRRFWIHLLLLFKLLVFLAVVCRIFCLLLTFFLFATRVKHRTNAITTYLIILNIIINISLIVFMSLLVHVYLCYVKLVLGIVSATAWSSTATPILRRVWRILEKFLQIIRVAIDFIDSFRDRKSMQMMFPHFDRSVSVFSFSNDYNFFPFFPCRGLARTSLWTRTHRCSDAISMNLLSHIQTFIRNL